MANLFLRPRKTLVLLSLATQMSRWREPGHVKGARRRNSPTSLAPTLDPISSFVRSFHWPFNEGGGTPSPDRCHSGAQSPARASDFVLSINDLLSCLGDPAARDRIPCQDVTPPAAGCSLRLSLNAHRAAPGPCVIPPSTQPQETYRSFLKSS